LNTFLFCNPLNKSNFPLTLLKTLHHSIKSITPSFLKTEGAMFRLQVHSRNYGQQSLALTVKARIQPIKLVVTQRLLAFLFEFKKLALPSKPSSAQREQTPTLNVWTESIFDEVENLFLFIKRK